MKKYRDLNIYYKILLVIFPMLLLLGILLGLLMADSLNEVLSKQFEARGVEITTRVASLSADPILVNDPYSLYEIANEVRNSSEDIRYVLITNHNSRLLAHTFQDGMPDGLLEAHSSDGITDSFSIEYIDTNEGLILDILVPIEGGNVGYARAGISELYIQEQIGKKLRDIIVITLGVCIFAALLAAKLTARITKPISALVSASREIAGGNLKMRLDAGSGDEIGILAEGFNQMADSLSMTNDERARLLEELREKENRRKILLRRLITAQEDERKHISRELHDEASQALTSLIVSMRLLANSETDDEHRQMFLEIRETAAGVLNNLRDLAVELRPPVLDDLGLVAAMQNYISKFGRHYGLQVELTSNMDTSCVDPKVSLALYRIMQEALTNAARHSGAQSIKVALDCHEGSIELSISDDGKGISKEALSKARKNDRIGIYGMQERAEQFGGAFEISSADNGTTIRVFIPRNTTAELPQERNQ